MEERHVHKYIRKKLGKNSYTIFACVLPGCSHYVRKELVDGRTTMCWRCGAEIVMTKRTATLKKPHCADCTREPTGKAAMWGMEQG